MSPTGRRKYLTRGEIMSRRRALGAAGESLATAMLKAKGYKIIERNARTRRGELDIIARSPDGVLVFVEVRTRRGAEGRERALESISPRKQQRLAELASEYMAASETESDARIDVVTIAVATNGQVMSVDHIENAVEGRD